MDISTMLHTMRDPAGVPAEPLLFQVLMVATWTLHIAFVNLALGAAGLALFSFYQPKLETHWERLSITMTQVAKISVSLLIVLGVAPLLFTQVIYDPQWYTSNVLSASWVIAFIFTLIIAYCLWFLFYYQNHAGAKSYIGTYAAAAIALFCLDGLIMHTLAYQALLPEHWLEWYAPAGVVDMSGSQLHAIHWLRYLFIMTLSLPAIGLYLIAYAQYFSNCISHNLDYLTFTRQLGQYLAQIGFGITLALFLIWQMLHPTNSGLALHPVGWLLAFMLVVMLAWTRYLTQRIHGYLPLSGGLAVLAVLSLWREIIRIHYLQPFHYTITDYPTNLDQPSLLLFFSTLAGVGGLVGGYFLTLLYQAGRSPGVYTASPTVDRLGTSALAVLIIWIAVFFTYGTVIWVHNNFLL